MIDLDRVAALIRDTAAAEILPRFGALGQGDVREKGPGDLVTVADLAAEQRLSEALVRLAPGSVVLGEEAVAADRSRLDLLAGAAPVWIIDPIDGTNNFVRGSPRFAVIVAYAERGVVTGGWIYAPTQAVMVMAARGAGAWSEGRRLEVAAPAQGLTGSAYGRSTGGLRHAQRLLESGQVTTIVNRGSSGLEYLEIALGQSHFTLHSRALPWDHAAGMLIVAEAGGTTGFLDGAPYDPRRIERAPLAAANAAAWRLVQDLVTAPATAP